MTCDLKTDTCILAKSNINVSLELDYEDLGHKARVRNIVPRPDASLNGCL